jgi:para-nitrobenzyl esterase
MHHRCLLIPIVVALFLCSIVCINAIETTTLHTTYGDVVGVVDRSAPIPVAVFKGIPFAEPPVSELRWKRPVPIKAWSPKVLNATQPKASCAQFGKVQVEHGPNTQNFVLSEDCLYLNLYIPHAKTADDKMALMVFVHGGSFTSGSANAIAYNALNLSRSENVMVAVIQYRLGILGFMAASELQKEDPHQSTGMYGMQDQREAFLFLKQLFRDGSCGPVTLFGESAGGASVLFHTLLAGSNSQGLFDQVIAESPAPWRTPTLPVAQASTAKVAAMLQMSPPLNVQALRQVEWEVLVAAANNLSLLTQGKEVFIPVIDGSEWSKPPLKLLEEGVGLQMKGPVMIGHNANEGTVFEIQNLLVNDTGYRELLRASFNASFARELYTLYNPQDYVTPFGAISAVFGDAVIACPAFLAATYYRTSYRYLFTAPLTPILGACHTVELAFVFQNQVTYDGLPFPFDAARQSLAVGTSAAWSSFAFTGIPVVGTRSYDAPNWPSLQASGQTMTLGLEGGKLVKEVQDNERVCGMWLQFFRDGGFA